MLPGYIEDLNFIIDVQDVSLFQIPYKVIYIFKTLSNIINELSFNNPEMLGNIFILNHGTAIYLIWSFIKCFLFKTRIYTLT